LFKFLLLEKKNVEENCVIPSKEAHVHTIMWNLWDKKSNL